MDKMTQFENTVSARLSDEQIKELEFIVSKNGELFASVSHFVRSAVIAKMREFNENQKKGG